MRLQLREQRAAGRIGKCRKGAVESLVLILNHLVKLCRCLDAVNPIRQLAFDIASGASYGPRGFPGVAQARTPTAIPQAMDALP